MKILYEYIDLKKIIKKLQDIDKLKNVIFNDSERFFFDLISKPEINLANDQTNHNLRYSLDSSKILGKKFKNVTGKELNAHFQKIMHSHTLSNVNERIFAILDKDIKEKLRINDADGK